VTTWVILIVVVSLRTAVVDVKKVRVAVFVYR